MVKKIKGRTRTPAGGDKAWLWDADASTQRTLVEIRSKISTLSPAHVLFSRSVLHINPHNHPPKDAIRRTSTPTQNSRQNLAHKNRSSRNFSVTQGGGGGGWWRPPSSGVEIFRQISNSSSTSRHLSNCGAEEVGGGRGVVNIRAIDGKELTRSSFVFFLSRFLPAWLCLLHLYCV